MYIYIYQHKSKSDIFFFTGKIIDTGTCIIHQKDTGPR